AAEARALEPVSGADDPVAALVRAIGSGRHDADVALHAALLQATDIAAGIWKPEPAGQGEGG
ncbi:hypothetical protein ACFQ12_03350, partial [Methylobacterium trifolii]